MLPLPLLLLLTVVGPIQQTYSHKHSFKTKNSVLRPQYVKTYKYVTHIYYGSQMLYYYEFDKKKMKPESVDIL
ncbi:Hypothetical predicted protein [Octopus vulgaris]|uniref:Uncharacterized protein n=1 Tax=Octopus vulgaris TaxID=6645 RepID=A0AA36AYQ6_OCTVU|nr:Hypothetical predicted protein [Octopus vulgaris]